MREDLIPATIERTIWDELPPSNVDTLKLEHLFESRAKDLLTKVNKFDIIPILQSINPLMFCLPERNYFLYQREIEREISTKVFLSVLI